MSGGGESPASCTRARPRILHTPTYEKAVSGGGEREKGGHVLRDTTSRGLYVRVFGLWSVTGLLVGPLLSIPPSVLPLTNLGMDGNTHGSSARHGSLAQSLYSKHQTNPWRPYPQAASRTEASRAPLHHSRIMPSPKLRTPPRYRCSFTHEVPNRDFTSQLPSPGVPPYQGFNRNIKRQH